MNNFHIFKAFLYLIFLKKIFKAQIKEIPVNGIFEV